MQTSPYGVNLATSKTYTRANVRFRTSRRKMVPMSSEMKEVLSGLARFDLLPDEEQKDQLKVPEGRCQNRHSPRSQSQGRRKLLEDRIGKPRLQGKYPSRETGNKLTNNLSRQSKQSSLAYAGDEDNKGAVFMRGTNDVVLPLRRSRANTTPWSHHFNEEEERKIPAKQNLRLTLSLGIPENIKEHENEVNFNNDYRPRAATFPLSMPQEQNEFSSPSGICKERYLHAGSKSAVTSQRMKKYHRSSQEELDNIVGRCENWFTLRGHQNKSIIATKTATKK